MRHLRGPRDLPPIQDYGLLGDTRTGALVAPDGSIDWLCAPRFDSKPLFARLVGGSAAGRFRMGPATPSPVIARRYRPGTATIETVWKTDGSLLTLTEAMVANVAGRLLPTTLLVRRLSADAAPAGAAIEFDPRLGEHRRAPRAEYRGGVLVCSWPAMAMALRSTPPVQVQPARP